MFSKKFTTQRDTFKTHRCPIGLDFLVSPQFTFSRGDNECSCYSLALSHRVSPKKSASGEEAGRERNKITQEEEKDEDEKVLSLSQRK